MYYTTNIMQVFNIIKGGEECCVAAGLSMPVILNYSPNEHRQHTGEIEVYVGDHISEVIPVMG